MFYTSDRSSALDSYLVSSSEGCLVGKKAKKQGVQGTIESIGRAMTGQPDLTIKGNTMRIHIQDIERRDIDLDHILEKRTVGNNIDRVEVRSHTNLKIERNRAIRLIKFLTGDNHQESTEGDQGNDLILGFPPDLIANRTQESLNSPEIPRGVGRENMRYRLTLKVSNP